MVHLPNQPPLSPAFSINISQKLENFIISFLQLLNFHIIGTQSDTFH